MFFVVDIDLKSSLSSFRFVLFDCYIFGRTILQVSLYTFTFSVIDLRIVNVYATFRSLSNLNSTPIDGLLGFSSPHIFI